MKNAETPAIEAVGISRQYNGRQVLGRTDLLLDRGDSVLVHGARGSGKTIMWSILTAIVKPTTGSVRLLGRELDVNDTDLKRRLGIVPDHAILFESLTCEELLMAYGRIYGLSREVCEQRVDEAIEALGLSEDRRSVLASLSCSRKKLVRLGCGLLHGPELLLLDEGLRGLTDRDCELFWRHLAARREECGMSVFATSDTATYLESGGVVRDIVGSVLMIPRSSDSGLRKSA